MLSTFLLSMVVGCLCHRHAGAAAGLRALLGRTFALSTKGLYVTFCPRPTWWGLKWLEGVQVVDSGVLQNIPAVLTSTKEVGMTRLDLALWECPGLPCVNRAGNISLPQEELWEDLTLVRYQDFWQNRVVFWMKVHSRCNFQTILIVSLSFIQTLLSLCYSSLGRRVMCQDLFHYNWVAYPSIFKQKNEVKSRAEIEQLLMTTLNYCSN